VSAVTKNPLVQGGLDVVGSAFGDPELGQEVSSAVATVAQVAPVVVDVVSDVVGGIGSAISSIFGGGGPDALQKQIAGDWRVTGTNVDVAPVYTRTSVAGTRVVREN